MLNAWTTCLPAQRLRTLLLMHLCHLNSLSWKAFFMVWPTNISPEAFLKTLATADVLVYTCNRSAGDTKVPIESITVLFAGLMRPKEAKARLYLFRLKALTPRPLQRRKCWWLGHSANTCRSSTECRSHSASHRNTAVYVGELASLRTMIAPPEAAICNLLRSSRNGTVTEQRLYKW